MFGREGSGGSGPYQRETDTPPRTYPGPAFGKIERDCNETCLGAFSIIAVSETQEIQTWRVMWRLKTLR